MIITRTPFRISFFGGGTDYPVWYEKHGGSVLSMAIDKYSYINLRFMPPFFKHKYKIIYSKKEEVKHINKIKHPSVRETLRYVNLDRGVVIHHDGDLPAMSGLGSSSSFTVGLVHALAGLKGEIKTKRQLALDAIHIEQNLIKENVGSQDQTIAAFGGLNRIDFGGPQKIQVHPITINKEREELFKSHLMLFFTDFTRRASTIAKNWIKNTKNNTNELKSLSNMVDEGVAILCSNRDITDFGKLLNEHWQIKRGLAQKISNPQIDEIYKTGREAGAIGGKLLGAGGGGFMLFFAKPEDQPRIKEKLKKFLYVPFNVDMLGSQIIYHNPNNSY
jgi:D-glycero-alpha-D-manno-heptose-7-phosphate kinase